MDITDLFLNQDYVLQDFTYGEYKLDLYCSQSATTDYDLTGQIIWPSAIELSRFIIDRKEEFVGKNVLELGAGAGLSGIVAHMFAAKVVITDGNEIITKLLQKNVDLHQREQTLIARQFIWGTEEAEELLTLLNFKVDIIIGADIIFWSQSVLGLAQTISVFSKHNKDLKVYITGSKRFQQSEDDIDLKLQELANKKRTTITIIKDYKQPVYIYEVE